MVAASSVCVRQISMPAVHGEQQQHEDTQNKTAARSLSMRSDKQTTADLFDEAAN
jgi:hypothetical protein